MRYKLPVLCICWVSLFFAACDKKENSPAPLSAFAQSLQRECITPFKGKGDLMDTYLPTAFTPNGDGINDTYGLCPTSTDFPVFSLHIYDTTGLLVFQTNTASGAIWDGIDMNTGVQGKKYKYYVKIAYTTSGNVTDSGSSYLYLLATSLSPGCVKTVPADRGKYLFPDQFIIDSGFNAQVSSFETFCN